MKWFALAVATAVTCLPGMAAGAKPKPAPAAAPAIESAPLTIEPAAIESALKGMVDSKQIIGVSALVYQHGREVFFGAYGLADRENNKPMTRDTIVQIF